MTITSNQKRRPALASKVKLNKAGVSPLPSGRLARWVNIAQHLRRDLVQGRWPAGERLPASRQLAAEFDCNRETLFAALDQLQAEGWLISAERRGFFVKSDVCERPVARQRSDDFSIPLVPNLFSWPPPTDLSMVKYCLHTATPDPLLFPRREFASALSFALRRLPAESFDACPAAGLPRLREVLCKYLRRRRALVAPDVVLTAGSQAALSLVAKALIRPGDRVAVESPGYRPAWQAFQTCGAELVPIAVDGDGLDVGQLEAQLSQGSIRALYVTPARQYPTTVTLAAQRRRALLELTRRKQIVVIEDDYDHEHSYRPLSVAPLAAHEDAAHVLYIGTLSKLVSPSVRVGYVAGASAVLGHLAALSAQWLGPQDAITQAGLAIFIEEGALDRHLARTRRVYEARRDALHQALAHTLPELKLICPEGGLALFAVLPKVCSLRFARAALKFGVSVMPEGLLTHKQQSVFGVRLAFSRLDETQAPAAVEALSRALHSLNNGRHSSGTN